MSLKKESKAFCLFGLSMPKVFYRHELFQDDPDTLDIMSLIISPYMLVKVSTQIMYLVISISHHYKNKPNSSGVKVDPSISITYSNIKNLRSKFPSVKDFPLAVKPGPWTLSETELSLFIFNREFNAPS